MVPEGHTSGFSVSVALHLVVGTNSLVDFLVSLPCKCCSGTVVPV